ncbi:wall-associated receptor kinase 2-like [Miscanthus floridulus]|uniref:wall-associated receptor kinase 2-like n=1 Tax=Miscanthus floridulus TaxID=154761 RepID=UPI0034577ECA
MNNSAWDYSPCKHSFVAHKDWYKFSRQDLEGKGNDSFGNRVGDRDATLVLDWAIRGNGSCQKVLETSGVQMTAPACVSAHSYCEDLNATRGGGYLCKCSKGYMGNPYIHNGCTNINECTDPRYANTTANGPCGMYTKCKDTDGDFLCECIHNRKGDGKSEKGCYHYKFPPYAMVAVATIFAIVLACFAVILLQKRNQRKLVNKNGGKILAANGITIYTKREVDKITKRYSNRLGGGNFGDVFQGSIDGAPAQLVAVKCSVAAKVARRWQKMIQYMVPQHEQQHEQEEDGFVNEIIFQFKIRHTNVVKLIGCCLETDIPILVYELVSNGSLHDALHGTVKRCTLSLLKRLDIAIGSAEALTHMHSHGDHVHGDMKTANILLDKDLKPKVSDFGSSKLLSIDRYARAVAADRSYTDPVYMKTDRFTVKSDVYSFGIVLLELITRKTAKYDENKSLPLDFVKCFKDEGSGRSMYDREIFSGDDAQSHRNMKCLDMVGSLGVRCLKEDVEERPTMAEVLEELKQVKVIASGGSSCSEAI